MDFIQLELPDPEPINPHHPFPSAQGKVVFDRTYSRYKHDGTRETWFDTVRRVAAGNIAFVHGTDQNRWSDEVTAEYSRLVELMDDFSIVPAGRHLWATGAHKDRSFVSNCLAYETEVVTDEGIIKIGDQVGQQIRVKDGNNKWTEVEVRSYGVQELRKITFSYGRSQKVVYATGGHRWLMNANNKDRAEFVTTDELTPSHRVQKRAGRQGSLPNLSSIGVQAGFIYGDGTANDSYGAKATFCGPKDHGLLEHFSNVWTREAGPNILETGSVFPRSFKGLPSLSEGRSFLYGWLAGYFAADGCVDENGMVMLNSANRESLEFVRSLASILGIGTTPITVQSRRGFGTEDSDLFKIVFDRYTLNADFFLLAHHEERWSKSTTTGNQRNTQNWKVVSVETTSRKEEVFCVEVPSTQTFLLADGLLTGNCFYAHWTDKLSEHFTFTLLRLAEGGGVGSNYSQRYIQHYPKVKRNLTVHITCDPSHPNYEEMLAAGLLSTEYSHEWTGSFAVEDTREGWADAMSDLIDTFVKDAPVLHQNRVYDMSRVRGKGSPLRTFGGVASGPEPFAQMLVNIGAIMSARFEKKLRSTDLMEIDHEIGACVVAGGNRRSARMSLVNWNDPNIMDFLKCKSDPSKHWTTNISVEIDDEFIELVKLESAEIPMGPLVDGGQEAFKKYTRAHKVYREIIKGMLSNGEPGMWNYSLNNEGEPNEVQGCNPCAEISLSAWESCILGHVNLDNFGFHNGRTFNDLKEAHALMTRFLIRATYGTMNDEKQAEVVGRNRRIGVGHFGVQAYLAKHRAAISDLTLAGSGPHGWFNHQLAALKDEVREEARRYAFQLRIPEPVKVTTIAPTGSIAKMPGVTEGIHPIYARFFERRIRFSTVDPKEVAQLESLKLQGYKTEVAVNEKDTMIVVIPTKDKLVAEVEAMGIHPSVVESADEISLRGMLTLQTIYQENYADNAISMTVNIPAESHQNEYFLANPWGSDVPPPGALRIKEVGNTLLEFLPYLKGTTIMVDGSRQQAPYTRISESEYEALIGPKSVEDGTDSDCSSGACPIK